MRHSTSFLYRMHAVAWGNNWFTSCKTSVKLTLLTHLVEHGCARVAHCVTARWRNFSHYCCPLCQYDVFWAQRSTRRCADRTRCTQTRVYSVRGKCIVRHWTSREATLRHSSGWGTWSVSPQYRDLRTRVVEYDGEEQEEKKKKRRRWETEDEFLKYSLCK